MDSETDAARHLAVLLEACERMRDAAGKPIRGEVRISCTAHRDFAAQIKRTKQDIKRTAIRRQAEGAS